MWHLACMWNQHSFHVAFGLYVKPTLFHVAFGLYVKPTLFHVAFGLYVKPILFHVAFGLYVKPNSLSCGVWPVCKTNTLSCGIWPYNFLPHITSYNKWCWFLLQPRFEKMGLYWIWVVRHSVCHSVLHNFVSAQYLENKMIEFHQILYMHWYWQNLGWDCYLSIFAHLYQSYDPWFMPKFYFRSISWEHYWQNFTKF